MPPLRDKDVIRARLRQDPRWCVYALGDLTPRMFDKCQWFTPDLTLVLREYGTAILFAVGTGSVREALSTIDGEVHLQVQQEAYDVIAQAAHVERTLAMSRMAWTGAALPTADPRAKRLHGDAIADVQRLYADGEPAGDAPDFFYPSMVSDGVFFGIYEGDALVAAAGTHLVARDEGAAAIGNVYTRRDRRGHGLGRAVTAAVLRELKDVETVALNVRADNAAAISLYASLGFVPHCRFYEALARPAPLI